MTGHVKALGHMKILVKCWKCRYFDVRLGVRVGKEARESWRVKEPIWHAGVLDWGQWKILSRNLTWANSLYYLTVSLRGRTRQQKSILISDPQSQQIIDLTQQLSSSVCQAQAWNGTVLPSSLPPAWRRNPVMGPAFREWEARLSHGSVKMSNSSTAPGDSLRIF